MRVNWMSALSLLAEQDQLVAQRREAVTLASLDRRADVATEPNPAPDLPDRARKYAPAPNAAGAHPETEIFGDKEPVDQAFPVALCD